MNPLSADATAVLLLVAWAVAIVPTVYALVVERTVNWLALAVCIALTVLAYNAAAFAW